MYPIPEQKLNDFHLIITIFCKYIKIFSITILNCTKTPCTVDQDKGLLLNVYLQVLKSVFGDLEDHALKQRVKLTDCMKFFLKRGHCYIVELNILEC